MSVQKKSIFVRSKEYIERGKQLDKKKKKHLLKTFIIQGRRKPFTVPIGLMAHLSPKTCQKLDKQGINTEQFQ